MGVLLVVVGLGVNGVVRLAPSAVVVRAVGLLGPLVVVVAGAGGGTASGGVVDVLLSLAVSGGGGLLVSGGDLLSGVTVATISTVSVSVALRSVVDGLALAAVTGGGLGAGAAIAIPVSLGGSLSDGRGTIDVSVLAPSLGAPLIVVLVVPFVIGLGVVGLGPGLVVRLIDGEVLITAPSVKVGGGAGHAVAVAGLGGTLAGSSLDLGGTVGTVAVGSVGLP